MPIVKNKRRSADTFEKSKPLLNSTALRKTQSSSFLDKFRRPKTTTVASGLECFEEAGKLLSRAATLQRQGAARLAEWAHQGGNSAMEDVTKKMAELYVLNEAEQRSLAQAISTSMQQLRRIDDTDGAHDDQREAERRLGEIMEHEKKLHAGVKRDATTNVDDLRSQLRRMLTTAEEKERIERVLDSFRAENEVVKMLRFRSAIKGLAESYVDHYTRVQDIFLCQRELSELVPALATEDVRNVRYEGACLSREKVDRVRRSLDRSPRSNASESPRSQLLGTPQRRRRSEPPTRVVYSRHRYLEDVVGQAPLPETPPPSYYDSR